MIIVYIDILLLVILTLLTCFTCGYCFYRVQRLRQNGQVAILLRPRNVVFSHKNESEGTEELRTVAAYRNPLTGDYCVHKTRSEPKGYVNERPLCESESTDSGLSDAYESVPLHQDNGKVDGPQKPALQNAVESKNAVNKRWSWNYTEYQI